MLNEVIEMIKNFLAGNYEPLAFSYDLPEVLIKNYDEMNNENEIITKILNEELPDICAEYEEGMDSTEFEEKVRKEYEKAIA